MQLNNIQRPLIWEKIMEIVKSMYMLSRSFPKQETEGLGRMIRDKVTQLPVLLSSATRNGIHAGSTKQIGKASEIIFELETLLEICCTLGLLQQKECTAYIHDLYETGKELQKIQAQIQKKHKPS